MKYDILHELPGRMRVHCRSLRFDPGNRIELGRWVSQHCELVSASLSTKTGNLLIVYAKDTTRESILVILDDLRLFGVASIGGPKERAILTFRDAAAGAAMKEASKALFKSFALKPLQKFKSGWILAGNLFTLADAFLSGQLAAFFLAAGKFILLRLFSSSLPARLLLSVGYAMLANRVLPNEPESAAPAAIVYETAQTAG